MTSISAQSKPVFLSVLFMLGGCSTFSDTILNRSVVVEPLRSDGIATMALTADRRLAISKPVGDNKTRMCAEALPDVAKSKKLESTLNATLQAIEKGNVSAEIGEKLEEFITVAYQRTEKSDLVRQLGWQICQGYMNEAISSKNYYNLLEDLLYASIVDPSLETNAALLRIIE